MKLNRFIMNALVVAAVSSAASVAHAATKPSSITEFTPSASTAVLNAKKTAWRDPAFGNEGWSHSSAWGKFTAKAFKRIKIKLSTSVAGLHPGITVWYRGADDTAPDTYVPDHFYSQNANFVEFGAKDETTSELIGNISMQNVAYNYDLDGNIDAATKKPMRPWGFLKGLKDNVSGQMTLDFTTLRPGIYMFVVGGFNPDSTLTSTAKQPITVTVSGQ